MTAVDPAFIRRLPPKGAAFDPLFKWACFSAATILLISLVGILGSLLVGGWPALSKFGLHFFTSTEWNTDTDVYGAAGPIVGTLVSAALALVMSLPVAFGVAVFLVEFCPSPLRRSIGVAVELLAGIPSIVYGMWGLFVFEPLFTGLAKPDDMSAWVWNLFGFARDFYNHVKPVDVPNGPNILLASIILAIMILPYMAAVLRELLLTVPTQLRESGYGMGSTSMEVIWSVSLPYIRRSAVGAVMLGLGRALGETMAVTFVIGNSHDLPKSLLGAGSTIASTIANEFSEATGALYSSSLIALGLVLFVITFVVLAIARLLLGSETHA
jgi:phosphate transport system permease protein